MSESSVVTIKKWVELRYGEDGPSVYTVRRWIQQRKIRPLPQKHGRTYYLERNATYCTNKYVGRILHGEDS